MSLCFYPERDNFCGACGATIGSFGFLMGTIQSEHKHS